MIPDPRKLKRGLKDISPLFEASADSSAEVSADESGVLQCVGLYSPAGSSSQLFIQTLIAGQIIERGHRASILSLNPEHRTLLKNTAPAHQRSNTLPRFALSMDQFRDICSRHAEGEDKKSRNEVFFIDFDYAQTHHFEKVIPLLDKWIIHLKPEMDPLTEAYKMLKATLPLNGRLEYFLLLEGSQKEQRTSLLFERFSEIVSRHAGIGLNWFGTLRLTDKLEGASFVLENLAAVPRSGSIESIEKHAIAKFFHSPAAQGMMVS